MKKNLIIIILIIFITLIFFIFYSLLGQAQTDNNNLCGIGMEICGSSSNPTEIICCPTSSNTEVPYNPCGNDYWLCGYVYFHGSLMPRCCMYSEPSQTSQDLLPKPPHPCKTDPFSEECKNSEWCKSHPVDCNYLTWSGWDKFIFWVQQGISYGNLFCGGQCEDEWGRKMFGEEFMRALGDITEYAAAGLCGERYSDEISGTMVISQYSPLSTLMHCEGTKQELIDYSNNSVIYNYYISYEIQAGNCDLNGTVNLYRSDNTNITLDEFALFGYSNVPNATNSLIRAGATAYTNQTPENFTKVCINLREVEPDFCFMEGGFNFGSIKQFCNDLVEYK